MIFTLKFKVFKSLFLKLFLHDVKRVFCHVLMFYDKDKLCLGNSKQLLDILIVSCDSVFEAV